MENKNKKITIGCATRVHVTRIFLVFIYKHMYEIHHKELWKLRNKNTEINMLGGRFDEKILGIYI